MPGRCSTPSTTCSAARRSRRWQVLRQLGGAQPYPSRVKDGPEVDFSTGSVGLGVAMTTFAALMADYVRLHGLARAGLPPGRHIAIAGDAELDEGNIYEALAGRLEARRPRCLVDHRLQPPEPRLRRAGPAVRPHRGPVPRHGLERRHHQIRPQAGGRVRARGRRGSAALDRRLPEQPLLGADLPGRCRLAAGGAGRSRPLERRARDHRSAVRRRAGGADDQSRRPRHRNADRDTSAPPPPRATSRPASSPTPSRAWACRSPATRTTTPA